MAKNNNAECINRINGNPNTFHALPSASHKMKPFHQMPSTSLGKALLGQQNMTQILGGLRTKNCAIFQSILHKKHLGTRIFVQECEKEKKMLEAS